jgi:hypothetical protein
MIVGFGAAAAAEAAEESKNSENKKQQQQSTMKQLKAALDEELSNLAKFIDKSIVDQKA